MKSFFQFLESTAVQQATRMGLTSDGHGGWYDKKGEFVAKTEKGSLKFFNNSFFFIWKTHFNIKNRFIFLE